MGYSALSPHIRPSGPVPHKSFNKLSLLLVKSPVTMIMRTLPSMVYGLLKPCWLMDVSCTCFKETTPLFNVRLSCFVDFILYPTDKYMFKVKNKKKLINLLNLFKVKSKHGMTSFRCIYGWPWPQSTYQHSVSTFNFKEAFVSSVRKTSHNVLQKQKARYLYVNKSWKAYFIQRFIIPPNWD